MASENNSGYEKPKSGLSSAEYRVKLLTKLNCLIAVLEVAISKISRSIDLPGANEERLMKIRSNLENTLSICRRAKSTLEKGFEPPAKRKELRKLAQEHADGKMTYRDYVELSSIEEYQKFKALPPISSDELKTTDVEDLLRKLSES